MLHRTRERPSRRQASKAGRTLATKRRGTYIQVAKSLSGTVLGLSKNRKFKRCSPKRAYKR